MKNKKLIFSVLFTGILFLNTFLFTNINENKLLLNSLFTLATAQTENVENVENSNDTDSKIKETCYCKKNGRWVGNMSITKCEEYHWYPPMVKHNCVTTVCPSGQRC